MSQLGDTVRVGDRGGVGVVPATCKLVEYCDEPNRGLLVVEETRDSCPDHAYTFCVPYSWWNALVMAEQATRELAEQSRDGVMKTRRITTPDGEELRIKGKHTGVCQIHTWATKGLAKRLLEAMRERHPKGIDACPPCIERAQKDARSQTEAP